MKCDEKMSSYEHLKRCSISMKNTCFSYCMCVVWDVCVDFESNARGFRKKGAGVLKENI